MVPVADDPDVGKRLAAAPVDPSGSEVEAGTFGAAGHGLKSSLIWAAETKNLPATTEGANRPFRISVLSMETVTG
jgi:hypothetical protein